MFSQNGKTNFACLRCREVASRPYQEIKPNCPSCRMPMEHMGVDFKAPRKSAHAQWEKVSRLIVANRRFTRHCSCCKPWQPVKTLSDAKSVLHQRRSDRKVWS